MNFKQYIIPAAAALLLGGCAADEQSWGGDGATVAVPVTTVITVGEPSSRATLTEQGGNLEWAWEKGDQVAVVNLNGQNIGTLTAGEPYAEGGGHTAPFQGTLNFDANAKTQEVAIIYAGRGKDASAVAMPFVLDLNSQAGTLASLEANAAMWTYTTVTIDPQLTVLPSFTLRHITAAAHFTLTDPDGNPLANKTVTLSGGSNDRDGFNAVWSFKHTLKVTNNGWTTSVYGGSDQSATVQTDADGSMYVSFIPKSSTSFRFSYKDGSKTYTGWLTKASDGSIVGADGNYGTGAGLFYRKTDGNPLPVKMVNAYTLYLGEDGCYGTVTQSAGKTPWVFYVDNFDTPTKAGCRFLGWADTPGATAPDYADDGTVTTGGPSVTSKTIYPVWGEPLPVDHSLNPLAKWAESDLKRVGSGASATGEFTGNPLTKGYYYQFGRNHGYASASEASNNYGCERSDIATNRNVYPGTGSSTVVNTYYANTIIWANYTNYFFIDNNHNGDYTTPDHNQTWYQRAKSMGYSNESPCPEGWRLPTVAECKEILPVQNGKAGWTDASKLWYCDEIGLAQVKTLANGAKCAFRWSAWMTDDESAYYMQIDARMVGEEVTTADPDDTAFWADSHVVTRRFLLYGHIMAHRNLWSLTNTAGVSTHYTARPLNWGEYYCTVQNNGTVKVSMTRSLMPYGGFFWTSDDVQGLLTIIMNTDGYVTGYNEGVYLGAYDRAIAADSSMV